MQESSVTHDSTSIWEPKKNLVISLFFCFLACVFWGLDTFCINWRAYHDKEVGNGVNQPLAVSFVLVSVGMCLSTVLFMIVWPQRPFEWMTPKQAFWSLVTGSFYAVGTIFYIFSANAGMSASVAAPLTGLHIAIPPFYYSVYHRECVSYKMAMGYVCSLCSLVLYSGALSGGSSGKITSMEWVFCILVIIGWGNGLVTQDVAGSGMLFKQFPQSQTWFTIGFVSLCCIFALAVGPNDIGTRSNWIPPNVDEGLMILASLCCGLGTGFFTICVSYAEDLNLVVGISSMFVTIPTVLGLVFLHEPASWNVILGLFFVCCGMIFLSSEALSKDLTPLRGFNSEYSKIYSSARDSRYISTDTNDTQATEDGANEKKIPLLSFH